MIKDAALSPGSILVVLRAVALASLFACTNSKSGASADASGLGGAVDAGGNSATGGMTSTGGATAIAGSMAAGGSSGTSGVTAAGGSSIGVANTGGGGNSGMGGLFASGGANSTGGNTVSGGSSGRDGGTGSPDGPSTVDGPASIDGRASSADAGPTFQLQTPNPLSVSPVLDPTHATVAVITATAGGSITATAADGTIYILAIPADALLFDTEITLTPVTSIGGLPFSGGLQAAVQIAPDGLYLYQVATLSIAPATAVLSSKQIGFGYYGSGTEFHLEALTTTGLVFGIQHFSGYGAGLGTAADVSQQELRPPIAPLDQLVQVIAQPLFLERPATIEPDPPPLPSGVGITEVADAYYEDDLLPDAEDALASGDPASIIALLPDVTHFAQECQQIEDNPTMMAALDLADTMIDEYANLADTDVVAECNALSPSELRASLHDLWKICGSREGMMSTGLCKPITPMYPTNCGTG